MTHVLHTSDRKASDCQECQPSAMDDFLRVLARFERERKVNRLGYLKHFTTNNRDVTAAAMRFAAEAADRHHIEERAVVYLVLGGNGWELDNTEDTYPLEGYDNGALNEACDLHGEELDAECEALRKAADYISGPNLADLAKMLRQSFPGT